MSFSQAIKYNIILYIYGSNDKKLLKKYLKYNAMFYIRTTKERNNTSPYGPDCRK